MTDEKNTKRSILWDLHRLPNFDYVKFTHLEDTGDGKQDLFMTLEGQKTWFRLACPNGGLVLNALRVTDAMAIFEARVFADANDRNPLASFTATKKADKATGDAYIRAAQDAALGEALKSTGFCLQTSVLAHVAKDAQPAKAPEEAPKPSPAPVQADTPMPKAEDNVPVQANVPGQKDGQQPVTAVLQPKPVADTAPRPASVDPQPHGAVASQPSAPAEARPARWPPSPTLPRPRRTRTPPRWWTSTPVSLWRRGTSPLFSLRRKPRPRPRAPLPRRRPPSLRR